MNDITPKEAIANLNHLYGMVAPDMQRSLDVAIKALERLQGDLIRRSDALKAVDNRHEELLHDTEYRRKHCQIDLLGIKKHILAIPPVDAIANTTEVRPQNKWIKIFENPFVNGYVCPFCGHKIQVTEQFLPKVTECESCGADMRGGDPDEPTS